MSEPSDQVWHIKGMTSQQMSNQPRPRVDRRLALQWAGGLGVALALSACRQPTAAPSPGSSSTAPGKGPSVPQSTPSTSAASASTPAGQGSSASPLPSEAASTAPSEAPSTVPASSTSVEPAKPSSAEPATTAPAGHVSPGLRPGAKGAEVVVLQKRLNELGFWVGSEDGDFGLMTRQGVAAAQKAAGIPIDAFVGPITTKALNAGIALTPRSSSGRVLEVDKARQLLLVVDGGRVVRYYNTSTGGGYRYHNKGTGQWETADTPPGTFTVFREREGWDPGPLGAIYRPMYFNGGIAVHGTNADVLDRPKSHGCVRLTLPMMDEIRRSGQIKVGVKVLVY